MSQLSQFCRIVLCRKRQSCRLVTIETLITILTIENLNSWQSLLPDNQEWQWTAFAILAMFGYPGYPSHTIMRAQAKLRIVRAFKPICQIEYLQRQWSGATGWVNLVNTVWVKFKERPNICYIEKVMERGPKKSKYGTTALWHYGTMTLGHDGTTASKKNLKRINKKQPIKKSAK